MSLNEAEKVKQRPISRKSDEILNKQLERKQRKKKDSSNNSDYSSIVNADSPNSFANKNLYNQKQDYSEQIDELE